MPRSGGPYAAAVPARPLEEVLAGKTPGRIVDVIERMRAITAALPPSDGVACFTALYLAVTEAVYDALRPGAFRDPRFVRWLDVVFANLFFEALRDLTLRTRPAPRAWRPLVERRDRRGIAALQFALAGMNAHINRDLPVALVETWRALRIEPSRPSPQYDDFTRINDVLAETEERVKARFATGALGHLDRALGRDDDVLAMWNVRRAREAAWSNGETLWALRHTPHLRGRFLTTLDGLVGFASRGLLRQLSLPT